MTSVHASTSRLLAFVAEMPVPIVQSSESDDVDGVTKGEG